MIERKLTTKQRNSLKDSDFGIPETRSYPLNDKSHVEQAIRMFNKVDAKYESELARNIIKAIKRFNLDVTVGDENRFKKYYLEGKNSGLIDLLLSGKSIRELILTEESESYDFEALAKKFKSYLTSHYSFVKSVDLDIAPETKYISNFFIWVKTSINGYYLEDSIEQYNLSDVITGETISYGTGGPQEVDYTESNAAECLADLFYADAIKIGLKPTVEKKRYSIMKYNNDSYHYRHTRNSDGTIDIQLEFYTNPE